MGSREDVNWLPGLGSPPPSSQNSFSVPPDPEFDEVEYSVVCDGCGKHFWSLSKAYSHAALTAHVLHKETISPSSHAGVLHSPVNNSARALETNTVFPSTAEAEANTDTSDQEDGEDSGDDKYPLCYECGRYFWSHEEADYHAKIGHMQDTVIIPSSDPDGWPTSASASPVLTPTSPAANSSIHPSYPYWNIGPGTASLAGNEGTTPNSPYWTTEPETDRAISPAYPLYDGGVNSTSPGYSEGANPPSMYLNTSPTSGHAMTLFGEQFARPFVPNSESQASRSESDGNLRRSPGGSPSPSAYGLPSMQDVPRSVNAAIQTISTPRKTAPPSPSSSCGTLDHPQVTFPLELFDRIFFIVTPSGNRKGPNFIMGLPEAQNLMTFRAGVRARLESQGEQVGSREIVARPSWLSVPVYADTNEDHHLLLLVIKNWPEWQKTNGNTSSHVFVTLQDEKEGKEQGEKQQEIPGAAED